MSPQAVRVRTSSGWQDIALTGPPGLPLSPPWQNWTPQLWQNSVQLAKTINRARYVQIGKFVHAECALTSTVTGTAGLIQVTLPVPAAANYSIGGTYWATNAGLPNSTGIVVGWDVNTAVFIQGAQPSNYLGYTPAYAIVSGNQIQMWVTYEAATDLGGSYTPVVTALPASPVDGQECYFWSASLNQLFHLKYVAAASGSYKWAVIGGASIFAPKTMGPYTLGTGLWIGGGTITPPLSGLYDVSLETEVYGNPGVGNTGFRVQTSPGAVQVSGDAYGEIYAHGTNLPNFGRLDARANLTGTVQEAYVSSATISIRNRLFKITPVWVG